MKKTRLSIVLVLILVLLAGCSKGNSKTTFDEDSDKLNVYVSFYPVEFLTRSIGGEKINLASIVPEGVDPHDFEPSLKDMKNIEKTDLFVYNGLGLEPWADDLIGLGKESLKSLNLSDGIKTVEGHHGTDPHIWLNPKNMKIMAENIKNVLSEEDSENKDFYEKNYEDLSLKLEKLDLDFEKGLKDKTREDVLVSHEAFTYMADRYGFNQLSVSGISGEEEPSPKNLANLIDLAKEKDIRYIFLETLSNSKSVEVISKEAGLEVLVLNPLEGLRKEDIEAGKDYIDIMYENLEALKKALVI